jgi:hypothetical protein
MFIIRRRIIMRKNPLSRTIIVFIFLLSILLLGCAAPTTVSQSEDHDPQAESETDFLVTYPGDGCEVSGPEEVPPGEYIVELDDQTDTNMLLYVSKLLDGKTFQEWVDEQETPGVYYPKPDYVEVCSKQWISSEEESFIYTLDEALVYVFYVYNMSPQMLWKCGFTTVVE